MGIPPALDRALARAVLGAAEGRAPEAGGGPPPALPAPVADAVTHVADALAAQGATADAVRLALKDAFAALLAGQTDPARRGYVRAVGAGARAVAEARLRSPAADGARPSV